MIHPDDEKATWLGAFYDGLMAATTRERVVECGYGDISAERHLAIVTGREPAPAPVDVSPVRSEILAEARALADAVVEEAKRIHGERKQA